MAQGYTRQSTANIVNGAVIDALYLNNEFNQLEAAFNVVSGHTHDGSAGGGSVIPFTNISGILSVSAGGTGLSGGAYTTSGQVLISNAAGSLSLYTIQSPLVLSGTKLEVKVSAPLTISGTQLGITLASSMKISGGKLDVATLGTPIGLIYILS